MRVLVVKPSSLGDIVHTFPAVELLRQKLGWSSLSWVVNSNFADILDLYPFIDRKVRFPRHRLGHWSDLKAFVQSLRSESYDVVIDFQGLLRSGLISRLSGCKRRVGFGNGREGSPWFYTESYIPQKGILHAVAKNVDLVRQAFQLEGDVCRAPLRIREEWQAEAEHLLAPLSGDGPVVAVACASRWRSKDWPLPCFAQTLELVAQQVPNVRCWLLGAPADVPRCEQLVAMAPKARPLNLAGKTSMTTLAALLATSSVLLTNDSGPMHIAAALGTACVALFGATNPSLTGPYGESGLHEIIRSRCPKSPCFQKECPKGEALPYWYEGDIRLLAGGTLSSGFASHPCELFGSISGKCFGGLLSSNQGLG